MASSNSMNMDESGVQTYNTTTGDLTGSTTTQYDVLVGAASNKIGNVGPGSAGQVLQSGGASANPAYSTATYPSTAGTSGNVMTSNGTNWVSSAAAGGTVFTQFTASGTWTKNAAAKWVEMYMWSGGAGGGSGRRGAAGSNRSGGGGGGGPGVFYYTGPAIMFGTTETVTVGAGGAGGASQTTNDTNGINGTSGGVTSVGNINASSLNPFNRGAGGSTTVGSGGEFGTPVFLFGYGDLSSNITSGSGTNTAGQAGSDFPFSSEGAISNAYFVNGPSGGGGGLNTSNTAAAGGRGGNFQTLSTSPSTLLAGGAAGTVGAGQIGGNGTALSTLTSGGFFGAGTGGGGGAANASAAAGKGGNGAAPGGGGGGGGASVNGQSSGAGGDGARGEVWIIEFL